MTAQTLETGVNLLPVDEARLPPRTQKTQCLKLALN